MLVPSPRMAVRRANAPGPARTPKPSRITPFLQPTDHRPGDVLYQPVLDGEAAGLIVEIDLSDTFFN